MLRLLSLHTGEREKVCVCKHRPNRLFPGGALNTQHRRRSIECHSAPSATSVCCTNSDQSLSLCREECVKKHRQQAAASGEGYKVTKKPNFSLSAPHTNGKQKGSRGVRDPHTELKYQNVSITFLQPSSTSNHIAAVQLCVCVCLSPSVLLV